MLVLAAGGSYGERNREDALRHPIELIRQATTQAAPTLAAGVVACQPYNSRSAIKSCRRFSTDDSVLMIEVLD